MEDFRLKIARESKDEMTLVLLALTLRPDVGADNKVILTLASRGMVQLNYVLVALVADCSLIDSPIVQDLCMIAVFLDNIDTSFREVCANQLRKTPVELLRTALGRLDSGRMHVHTLRWILNAALSAKKEERPTVDELLSEWLSASKEENPSISTARNFIFYVRKRLQGQEVSES